MPWPSALPGDPAGTLRRVLAGDVVMELVDGGFLRRYDPVHQVADGNNARHRAILHRRKMTDTIGRHNFHALFHGMLRSDANDLGGHDFLDLSFLGMSSF